MFCFSDLEPADTCQVQPKVHKTCTLGNSPALPAAKPSSTDDASSPSGGRQGLVLGALGVPSGMRAPGAAGAGCSLGVRCFSRGEGREAGLPGLPGRPGSGDGLRGWDVPDTGATVGERGGQGL